MAVSADLLRRAPKVLLHDHLDGGLRPATLVALAAEAGYRGLPTADPEALRAWFVEACWSGSLGRYLETFAHPLAVLQTEPALRRVAAECVEDLAADGVVHAEVRFAPELATAGGLTLDQVVGAVLRGFEAGRAAATAAGRPMSVGLILCAMRQGDRSAEVARAVLRHLGRGVVGFDLAGPEAGYPASGHARALAALRAGGAPITLHAGEAAGPASVQDALDAGAERVGHGVRVVEDPDLLARVAAEGIPLEVCPTSNLQTGVATSYVEHPFGALDRAGVAVTVNTDNRLMSGTTVTRELSEVCAAFGYGLRDVERFTLTAARAAFLPAAQRATLAETVQRGFATLRRS